MLRVLSVDTSPPPLPQILTLWTRGLGESWCTPVPVLTAAISTSKEELSEKR